MATDGLGWAAIIDQRIAGDNANAWLYWQMIDYNQAGGAATNTDGSLMSNPAGGSVVAKRAYVLGQYSKFVRPGYFRIDATHLPQTGVSVSAYQDTATDALVIIATNYTGSAVSQTFDLANAPTFSTMTPTTTSASLSLAIQSNVSVSDSSFTYTLPAQSVTTFVGTGSGSEEINGVCGPANGTPVSSAPSTGLCSAGTASSVSGAGPWTWSCEGSGGGSTASCSAPVASSGGSLSGTVAPGSAVATLSSGGTTSWTFFDGPDTNGSGPVSVGPLSVTGTQGTYTNDQREISWTGGTPTASSANNTDGLYTSGGGFTFTVPASTTQQVVNVYVGGWESGGSLTATLSDGSASPYTNTSLSNATGQYDGVYTLTYAAASAGQTLTIAWKQASGTGNVTIQAASIMP